MAVTSDYIPVREAGNGSKQAFDFPFKIFNATDLVVSKLVRATDAETAMTLNVDYTVTINTDTDGGTVTYMVAPTALEDSFIRREVPITQEADIPSNNIFREKQIEDALDKQILIDQQLQEQLDRALLFVTTALAGAAFPALAPGFLYCDGALLSWATALTSLTYPGTIGGGDDADKSAYPSVKDIYFAVDTGIVYYCGVAGVWSQFSPTKGGLSFSIDGGGSAIVAGVKGSIDIPFDCVLTGWSILADQPGAIKIDIWKDTYANYPPTDADSMCNAHEPEIAASAIKAQDLDISDWASVNCSAGDIIRFNVDSCATIVTATITLYFTR